MELIRGFFRQAVFDCRNPEGPFRVCQAFNKGTQLGCGLSFHCWKASNFPTFYALGVGDEHDDTGELLSLLTLLGQQVHPMP